MIENTVENAMNTINEIATSQGAQDGAGIVASGLTILFGGPAGIILGVPALGLAVGKTIAHSSPETFDQEKVDKTADSVTGVAAQTATEILGGDSEKAGKIGDAAEGAGKLLLGGVPTNVGETADAISTVAETVDKIDEVVSTEDQDKDLD